jgi:hypothetical protein
MTPKFGDILRDTQDGEIVMYLVPRKALSHDNNCLHLSWATHPPDDDPIVTMRYIDGLEPHWEKVDADVP